MTAAGPRPLAFLPWLLASLAAHALVLAQWPQAGAPAEAVAETLDAVPLHVRLLPQTGPAQAAPAQPATAATIREARGASVEPRVAAETRTIAASAHAARREKAPARSAPATAAVLQSHTTTRTVDHAAHATGAVVASGGEAEHSADAAGRSELMSLLHAAIDRHKRYPQSALSMGREGAARVDFRLRPDGHIEDMNIGVSSGVRALDQAAYRAVQAIAPFTHAGRYLDSAQRFQVDVVFRLN